MKLRGELYEEEEEKEDKEMEVEQEAEAEGVEGGDEMEVEPAASAGMST